MRSDLIAVWSVALVVLASASAPVGAQTSAEATLQVPLQWFSTVGEPTTARQNAAATFSIERVLGDERGRVFYDMDVDTFGGSTGLRTWLHNGGATVTFGNHRRALDVGGSVFWRANEGDWADAGFSGVNALATAFLQPRADISLTAGYGLYARNFANQPALDQVEHFASIRFLANLPSRTTLVAYSSVGRKAYDGREITYGEVPSGGATPAGRGFGRRLFMPVTEPDLVGESGARTQWSWLARIAQSLDDRTGAWVEYEHRETAGDMPSAILWTPPLFYDDGVYDDPYVFDLNAWRAGVKHDFARGDELRGWVDYGMREFVALNRADDLLRAGLDAAVPIVRGTKATLDLTGSYQYVRDDSTDALESYRAHVLGAGIRIRF